MLALSDLSVSGLSLPGLIHSNYSYFNPFGSFKGFVLDAARRFAEHEQAPPASVDLSPSGTFTYRKEASAGDVEKSLYGVNFYVENYTSVERSRQEWLTKVEEKVAYRAYSSTSRPTTQRHEQVVSNARLPDSVASGTLRIVATESAQNVNLSVGQDAKGNTLVSVADPDGRDGVRSINFGSVARIEIVTDDGADSVSVSGSRFVGGVDIQTGAGSDVVSVDLSSVFGSGVEIDAGAGGDSVTAMVDNANLSISGGDGDDKLDVSSVNLSSWYNLNLYGGAGDDDISGSKWVDHVWGGDGNDTINLGAGNDYAYGGDGSDLIDGGMGDDYIDGGDGFDALEGGQRYTYRFLNYAGLSDNDYMVGQEGGDDMVGGAGRDVLLGKDGDDRIYGYTGEDTLVGGEGDDRMFGGAHGDFLEGDTGADLFAPALTDENDDENDDGATNVIRDFDASQGDVVV